MTQVIVTFTAKEGQGAALAAALSTAIQNTITKEGCYEAVLWVDDSNPDKLAMHQQWMSADAHKAYSQSLMTDPKMEKVMSMMQGPPVSTYYSKKAEGGGEWGSPQHLEISSNDTAATQAFLAEVFGWRFASTMEGYDGFTAAGAIMGGLRPKMPEEAAPQTIPYLVVEDLDASLAAVQAAGGQMTVPIQEVPHAGKFFWFIAPGGLPLACWQSFPKS